jgi:hypothetical protein
MGWPWPTFFVLYQERSDKKPTGAVMPVYIGTFLFYSKILEKDAETSLA